MLTVNNFKKDFQNLQGDCIVASLAINTLSSLCDPDLSSMVYRELFPLFTCTNPVIRKKVCALCVKIFLNSGENEEIIEELNPYLADRLKDANPSVRMAAVSAIYEISRVNPELFIVTLPVVYDLLCNTTNNWMLIKLIKLLTEFTAIEPRLVTKLKPKLLGLLE